MWGVFLPLQGVMTAVWGFHCSLSQVTRCPLPTMTLGRAEHGHTGFAAQVSRWALSLWDLQNLQCFAILLLSFLLSLSILFLFCFLILTMHSNTEIIRSPGQGWAGSVPRWMQTCACTCLAGQPGFKQDTNTGQQFQWNIWKETWKLEDNFSLFQQEKQGQFTTTNKVLELWNYYCTLFPGNSQNFYCLSVRISSIPIPLILALQPSYLTLSQYLQIHHSSFLWL